MSDSETSPFTIKIPKIFRDIKELGDSDKKGEFKQERMFGRVAKIPTSDAFSELVGMDFVDYGDYAAFLHIQDTFSRFPGIIFRGGSKRKNKRTQW